MSKKVLMECGHVANGVDEDNNPVCVICLGIHPGATIPKGVPDLKNRKAVCTDCRRTTKSSLDLPFFEYRGSGSAYANTTCKNCHKPKAWHMSDRYKTCDNFEPTEEGAEYDIYYCGCRGWN